MSRRRPAPNSSINSRCSPIVLKRASVDVGRCGAGRCSSAPAVRPRVANGFQQFTVMGPIFTLPGPRDSSRRRSSPRAGGDGVAQSARYQPDRGDPRRCRRGESRPRPAIRSSAAQSSAQTVTACAPTRGARCDVGTALGSGSVAANRAIAVLAWLVSERRARAALRRSADRVRSNGLVSQCKWSAARRSAVVGSSSVARCRGRTLGSPVPGGHERSMTPPAFAAI